MSETEKKSIDVDVEEKVEEEGEEAPETQSPLLLLADWRFNLSLPDEACPAAEKAAIKEKILAHIKEHKMAPYYESVTKELGWSIDEALLASLQEDNKKELAKLEEATEEARKKAGDTEIRDCLLAKADFLSRIGDKDAALKAYEVTLEKTVGSGGRIDVCFSVLRIGLMTHDKELIRNWIAKAKGFLDASGGDWERKNQLNVYEATYLVMIREIKAAAKLFLESVATFTATKLYTYQTFIFYTVVSAVLALDRPTLRKKVIESPDILSVVRDVPNLHPFVESLYKCHYADFLKYLVNISEQIKNDRYYSPHLGYYMREVRIVAYTQFLEAYKSVTLAAMGTAFGVTEEFLDRELARFIAAGRLNAKIDKVNGVVETNRPDTRNAQYAEVIKQGDLLLNRVQKLSKVITL